MDQTKEGQPSPANLFGDFSKMIEQFKLPGIDLSAVMEGRRKDIEALAAANRTAMEGVQSLNQKQAEILRTTMDQLQAIVRTMTAGGNGASAKTAQVVQEALQKAFSSMRELAETACKSQTDAFTVVSQRVQENIQEVKALLQVKK